LEPITTSSAVYPSSARQEKIQDRVVASILISEAGDVENVEILRTGATVLGQAAEEAIGKWKFKPVTRQGRAVPVVAKVTFDFVLNNDNMEPKDVAPDIAPAVELPLRVRVSDSVMRKLLLSKVTPIYPLSAKAAHIQGTVTVAVVIGKDGTVSDVQLLSGPSELASAAMDAVRQWRYRPYLLHGRPVEIQTTAQVNFTLTGM